MSWALSSQRIKLATQAASAAASMIDERLGANHRVSQSEATYQPIG
jgi:hypothetical protein